MVNKTADEWEGSRLKAALDRAMARSMTMGLDFELWWLCFRFAHRDEKPVCPVCKCTYKRAGWLRRHLRTTVHSQSQWGCLE